MRIPRYLEDPVRVALKKKMVLVGGPRQVGKTTFALGPFPPWSKPPEW